MSLVSSQKSYPGHEGGQQVDASGTTSPSAAAAVASPSAGQDQCLEIPRLPCTSRHLSSAVPSVYPYPTFHRSIS